MNIMLSTVLLTALAAAPIEQTVPIEPTGRVQIRNVSGTVKVLTHDFATVLVRATLEDDSQKLSLRQVGSGAVVRVESPKFDGARTADLVVTVPRAASIEVRVVDAKVDVDAGTGELRVVTVNGDVTAKTAGERVAVKTVSGDLSLIGRKLEVELTSVGGELEVEVEELTRSRVRTITGDVRLRTKRYSGDSHRIKAQSARVVLGVADSESVRVQVRSFRGDRVLGTDRDDATPIEVNSFSGQVELERR